MLPSFKLCGQKTLKEDQGERFWYLNRIGPEAKGLIEYLIIIKSSTLNDCKLVKCITFSSNWNFSIHLSLLLLIFPPALVCTEISGCIHWVKLLVLWNFLTFTHSSRWTQLHRHIIWKISLSAENTILFKKYKYLAYAQFKDKMWRLSQETTPSFIFSPSATISHSVSWLSSRGTPNPLLTNALSFSYFQVFRVPRKPNLYHRGGCKFLAHAIVQMLFLKEDCHDCLCE